MKEKIKEEVCNELLKIVEKIEEDGINEEILVDDLQTGKPRINIIIEATIDKAIQKTQEISNSELQEQIMNYLKKKIEEIREKELLREGEKMSETKTEEKYQLGLAEAQLLGFYHAQRGYSIADLISSMALNQKEWKKLQKGFKLTYLTKEDRKDIQSEVGKNE